MSSRFWFAGVACAVTTLGAAPRARAEDVPTRPPPVPDVHRVPVPDARLSYAEPQRFPTLTWVALQFLPSPELAVGRQRRIDAAGNVDDSPSTAFGMRWQVTPLLWSFGVNRHQPRWRTFLVDPIARQSGSLELSTSFEYIGGSVDRLFARPGVRVYLPVVQKGEYLSVSLGTSVYDFGGLRVAYDVGAYIFGGFLGAQLTFAPTHAPLATIATLRLRYF